LPQIWTEIGMMGSKTGLYQAVTPALESAFKSGFCARFMAAASGDSVWSLPLYTSLEIGLVFSEF